MRKVPSYPKITTKTNITVMQTQNININSPKAITVGFNPKKVFKATKSSTEKAEDSQPALHPSRSNLKHHFAKPNLNTRRQSSGNLNKPSKISDSREESNFQQFGGSKQELRKIEEKLKELQKKIDTLKGQKKKKKQMTSQRSHSKIKDATAADKKTTLSTFGKKKGGSVTKILKKTQSDKYLLHPPRPQKQKMERSVKHEDKELIHRFVTQVVRSQGQVEKKGERMHHHQQNVCYYIQNAVESLSKAYLLPFKDHLLQSLQTLKYLQNNRKPSHKQIQKHSITLPPSKFKHTLILDLDETLIHCNENLSLPHDVTLKIKFPNGQKIDAGVNVRPFAIELLRELSLSCEIIVFTASHECYANVVLDHLDPKRQFISHRLFRSHCWQTEQGVYIKDLRVIKNRNLENMLLVDNAAYSYLYQLENGVPILPFYEDKDDEELLHLTHHLTQLIAIAQRKQKTLKEINHSYFQLNAYTACDSIEALGPIYKESMCKYREMLL